METLSADVAAFRRFSRYFTRRVGVITDQYLGQTRSLGPARVMFEIGSGTSLRDLRSRLDLDPGYLSRMMRSLEQEGLVRVSAHPEDGRLRMAQLTEAGETELAEQNIRADAVAGGLFGALSADQRRELVTALGTAERLLRLAAIDIEAVDPASAIARNCLAAYVAELQERFPEGFDEAELVQPQEFQGRAGVFLVASAEGSPVGCGALRTFEPEVGEIRHVWVSADARRLGVGRRLLTELEHQAAARGFAHVRLGTHHVLAEANQLYRNTGYVEIPKYGQDPHAQAWFEKRLTPQQQRRSEQPERAERPDGAEGSDQPARVEETGESTGSSPLTIGMLGGTN